MGRILDGVHSPADLKTLTDSELALLAREIRRQIIQTTSKTGGHVASSLGAVEIILAVHSLIDSPKDRFIFDVGHQAYAHKLVTGRADEFDTLRTLGGISGFPVLTKARTTFIRQGMRQTRCRLRSVLRKRASCAIPTRKS